MTTNTKRLLIGLGVALGAFVAYSIFKAIRAGKKKLEDVFMAPFRAAAEAWTTVTGNAAAAATLPALHEQSVVLDNQIETMNQNDYAPGGRIYIRIANERGTLAADQAWANVQANLASQAADTAGWWQVWK